MANSTTQQISQEVSGNQSLYNVSYAFQGYNPTASTNINKTGAYAQTFNLSKSIREIDINSFMYYFFITVFLILMIVFLVKG